MTYLLKIEDATFKKGQQEVFSNLSFDWEVGQHWAVIDQSQAKSQAFLEVIQGKLLLSSGKILRLFAEEDIRNHRLIGEIKTFSDYMAVVNHHYPFKNKSNQQQFYYQQRFNSHESDEVETVNQYLSSFRTEGYWDKAKVIAALKLGALTETSLIKLSNGETRRLALASALLKNPKILILDQPLTGLDKGFRLFFDDLLDVICKSGIHVIMSTNPNEIPDSITHLVYFENGAFTTGKNKLNGFKKEQTQNNPLNEVVGDKLLQLLSRNPSQRFERLVELQDIRIAYGDKMILNKINWQISKGERWWLKGNNGAGKSTLISLLIGENPQAYSNDIFLFGKKRGSGESIWDIKKNVGFVAPELVRLFPVPQSCLKIVMSGLFDTMGLYKKVKEEQEQLAISWLRWAGLEEVSDRLITQCTLFQQRLVLLCRALIKNPALLILDEAAQGLDTELRMNFKNRIEIITQFTDIALIYVSHYELDVPNTVNNIFDLGENSKSKRDKL